MKHSEDQLGTGVTPVVTLPLRPPQFDSRCNRDSEIPERNRPKSMPRTARFLVELEWSWGMFHERQSRYFVSSNRARSHWILWSRSYDDNEECWNEELYMYAPRKGVPEKVAAIYLLLDTMRYEVESHNLDRFHWIEQEGLLDDDDLEAIAQEVWP